MASSIKPSEISEVLLSQLREMKSDLQFEEIGKVLQVSDGVVRIYGLDHAEAGELLDCGDGVMAVVMNLEPDNVGAVLMGPTDLLKEGAVVRRTHRIASIPVGEGLVGRVVDPLGNALDGLTVIFTGTSESFGRDAIKDFLTGHGAKYVGSVSSKVDYVIVGEKPGKNKLDKAAALGVTVIGEREFREKFGI